MRRIAAAVSSVAIAAGALVPAAAAAAAATQATQATQAEPTGLWSTDFAAHQTQADCGEHRLSKKDFCVANDARNGLEVGVKFQSSTELTITGIRIYRVDPAPLRASLWDSTGTLLAQGMFNEGGSEGWQDLAFAAPVTVVPGTTYVASYFTPATKYAFSYEYFAGQGRTVGPVTALPSTAGDPNGVHCYDDAPCDSFPVRGYKNSSYWVTPLWQAPENQTPGTPPTGSTVDDTPPRVTGGAPARGSQQVKVAATTRVKVRFSEHVRRDTLTRTTVRLLQGRQAAPVRVRLRYDADRQRVVLTPRKSLRSATTYRVVVTTGVRDVAGNHLDQVPGRAGLQKATWTFRTR
jgi:hypothetical protein